jgi:uncharacterized DUF497 family protein/predicted DNA binding CopG/RHH family protein
MEFEWDANKEGENLRKHGFSFAEAVEAFLDPFFLILSGFRLPTRSTQVPRAGTTGWGRSRAERLLLFAILVEVGRFVFLDARLGATLGDCTMREPKLKNLKFDVAETSKVRRSIKKQKSVKITINIDADSLAALKKEASASGAPYQRLLNRILKESLASKKSTESRIDRIERELREVKRRLTA